VHRPLSLIAAGLGIGKVRVTVLAALSLHFLGAGSAQGSPSDGRELGEREDDHRGSGKNHLDDPYAG
jgi:hypothetical protein